MKTRIRVLKVLKTVTEAGNSVEYKRLSNLVNLNIFNKENDEPLWGLELLNDMKIDEIILQNEKKKYSITQKGLDYLIKNVEK